MFLLNVSTPRMYSSAVLVAVLLQSFIDVYSRNPNIPLSYTFGYPKHGDSRMARRIQLAASPKGPVTFQATLDLRWQITCVKFTDNARNGAKIWISRWPPCYSPDISITSPTRERIDVTVEVYNTRPGY